MARNILILVSLLLASCSHNKASFEQTSLNQDSKTHYFSEIASKVRDRSFEPQMQWIYYEGKLKAYLNVFVGEIQGIRQNPTETLVRIKTKETSLDFRAPILKGSQRIKIPEEFIPQIIALFEKNEEATIIVGKYQTKLNLSKFQFMLSKSKAQHPLSKFKSVMIFDL